MNYLFNLTVHVGRKGALAFLGIFAIASFALADTHYVVKDNAGASSPFTDWTTAASNIQQAIDDTNCVASDTVMVANGVYNTGSQAAASQLTNRIAVTKVITVRAFSTNWADTVIEGEPDPNTGSNGPAAIRGVWLTNGAALIGFMITKGYANNVDVVSGYGGGVFCASNNCVVSNCLIISNMAYRGGGFNGGTVRNCLIANNLASVGSDGLGGGGYSSLAATLRNCVFSNNYGHRGGGGFFGNASIVSDCRFIYNRGNEANCCGGGINGSGYDTTISNCVFMYNYAKAHGGGVYRVKYIFNSLIANNRASGFSGGFHAFDANNKAPVNCTIVSNFSSTGIGGVGGVLGYLTNCIVYSNIGYNGTGDPVSNNISPNATSYYCCTFPMPVYGEGNITNNPAFANFAGQDYHLSPDSPCINKGTNQGWMWGVRDMDGHRRIIEGTVDIGAYEFLHQGTIMTLR